MAEKRKRSKFGLKKDLAKLMNVTPQTVTSWIKSGKCDDLIRKKDGKVNLTKAAEVLPGRIAPKQQASINARWGKEQQAPPPDTPATEAEVQDYLNESIGDLARLSISELQRRNELEKLLLAQIRRKKEDNELIDAAGAKKAAHEAGKHIKDQCTAIADRCAPLVAVEPDSFECKQIIIKEINYVLENLSKVLEVRQ